MGVPLARRSAAVRAWWLGQSCMLGLGNNARTTANLLREGECMLDPPSSAMVDAVDRIALTTGEPAVPDCKGRSMPHQLRSATA
ncbi:hypothetical protein [Streptomyces sp. WAC06614]|uniref:hypothetical protein n=1 Tax=Streptomyces sp. WAC06614 TaxID=2487416 RepID=UPI001C8DA32C|nr:hypothetical protein [Streptomyces sp. WAC06614]